MHAAARSRLTDGYSAGMPRLAIVVALLVALAGCIQQGDPTVAAPGSPPGPPVPTGTSDAVPEALAFTATTVEGEPFEGADHSGQDLMVWFWAPW